MNELKSVNLFDFSKTIARELFESAEYPWELLPKISEYIIKLGATLPLDKFDNIGDCIWVAKSAKVAPSASLNGPLIIDEEAEIRHCAFIRGNAIVGKGAVVGNSTELKNCILFDCTQTPHYNYVGDSIYGYKAHTGAGVIASNLKSDKSLVTVSFRGEKVPTGVKKFGAMVGDFGDIGCNTVMNPGTIIGRGTSVYPLSFVRGYVEANSIYKKQGEVVTRR